MQAKITVVVPIYNESLNIRPLLRELCHVSNGFRCYEWSYIFVNDGSSDNSLDILRAACNEYSNIQIIDFSRNFGKELALSAGLHAAVDADAVITLDADLQHPPEFIPQMIQQWVRGADMVIGVRLDSEKQPLFRKLGSIAFYKIMETIGSPETKKNSTDFRLFDKKVILEFCRLTERVRLFRGLMDWIGFRRSYVDFRAPARLHGNPGYSFGKLWTLAIKSFTSFSLFPLRIAGYMGLLITSISGALLIWMLFSYFFIVGIIFTPLAIVVVANTFLIGLVLLSIGLVAMYVGTIHTEVINRPLYVIREKINSNMGASSSLGLDQAVSADSID